MDGHDRRPTPTLTSAEAMDQACPVAGGRPAGRSATRTVLTWQGRPVIYLRHLEAADGQVLLMDADTQVLRADPADLTVLVR